MGDGQGGTEGWHSRHKYRDIRRIYMLQRVYNFIEEVRFKDIEKTIGQVIEKSVLGQRAK